VSTYRRYSALGEGKLGPGPRKQLAVLRAIIGGEYSAWRESITKEHAVKIAKKLKASILEEKAHSYAEIFERGKLIAGFGIRRGSEKDEGHDHVQQDLHVNGHQTRLLAACPLSRVDCLAIMKAKALID
jgi:hypothetical protein